MLFVLVPCRRPKYTITADTQTTVLFRQPRCNHSQSLLQAQKGTLCLFRFQRRAARSPGNLDPLTLRFGVTLWSRSTSTHRFELPLNRRPATRTVCDVDSPDTRHHHCDRPPSSHRAPGNLARRIGQSRYFDNVNGIRNFAFDRAVLFF